MTTTPSLTSLEEQDGRARISAIGFDLASLRDSDEGCLIVGYGAHGPSADCPNGHVSVTIHKSGETATSEAVHLSDAILMARAKVNDAIERREKRAALAKVQHEKEKGDD